MTSRNLMFVKLFYHQVTRTNYGKCCWKNLIISRQLSWWNHDMTIKRGLNWSKILQKTKESNIENIPEKENTGRTEDTAKTTVANNQSVYHTIEPEVKVVTTSGENEDHVKNQTVEGTQALMSTEPVKIIADKMVQKTETNEHEDKTVDINVTSSKRKRVDVNVETLERNFITPFRAMAEFLLKPSEVDGLRRSSRRSPYVTEPEISVFWRKEVEAKALEVWGSKEALEKEIIKRNIEKKKYQQNIFRVKRRLREYRREKEKVDVPQEVDAGLMGRSGRVILLAVAVNAANCLFKCCAWWFTGSHSMFSELIHSFADTVNQIILAFGIHKSVQLANSLHPYGYTNMKYVASLISGVGIFCVGTGLSFYHGISGLLHPEPLQDFLWGYLVLSGSLASEGATWCVAFNSIRKGAKDVNISVKEYILSSKDPSVNVVLLEDFAAVIGVVLAGGSMALSSWTNSSVPDAVGCLMVGGILGTVASFIIYTNVAALVGRSIPEEDLNKINAEIEGDVMIRAIHDVKGIDMGNNLVRYKAEIDFDGRELTKAYLDRKELNLLLEDCKNLKNIDEFEEFMVKHGENIVDLVGGEIDRIELKLRKKFPQIRHCDLEML